MCVNILDNEKSGIRADINTMRIDNEFKNLIAPLSAEEYKQLEDSIMTEGCREPIILWQNIIIDGHNRYDICTKHGIPYETVSKDFDSKQEAMAWMIDNQLGRRNISAVDRILLAQKKTALLEQQARENQKLGGRLKSGINSGNSSEAFDNIDKSSDEEFTAINIRRETADLAGVSEGTVAKVMKIQKEHPDLLDNVRRGEMSINRAYKSVVPHLSYASGENEWYTQPQYIEMARSVMGSIDIDPATSDVAQEWIKAATYYTAGDNGLDKDWYGNVWLNPPYAADLLTRFTEKLQHEIREKHVNQAIVLVNNATETRWFATLIKESDALCFAHGRTRFIKSLEDEPRSPMQGQAFIYFGNNVDSFASVFSEIGEIVVPYRPRLQD